MARCSAPERWSIGVWRGVWGVELGPCGASLAKRNCERNALTQTERQPLRARACTAGSEGA
eukprot:8355311-Alexandrium_andersonii.AAC.1